MNQKSVNRILQQTKEIYNRIATDFSRTRSANWSGFENFFRRIPAGASVLDLGCGNGRFADFFINRAISYLGVDQAERLIDLARVRHAGRCGVRFQVGDITKLDNRREKFDLILAVAVIHHLPTKELRLKVLKDIARLLQTDGRAIITVWNLWSPRYWRCLFDYRTKIARGVFGFRDAFVPWKIRGGRQMRYVHAYTAGELRWLLSAAGLKIDDCYYEFKGERAGRFSGGNLLALVSRNDKITPD